MPSDITVYTKPGCVQCDATFKKLEQLGATYTKVDITEDSEAFDYILGLGYKQAPVIVVGEHHRSGFSPDWLQWAAEQQQGAADEPQTVGGSTDPGN
ncbi:glutaredoxin family protein [Nocardia niwae]|uniref:glutaredoxin family protein n=1 Tax=Nocardia niwae TaxID=626084 RepID=UPI0007A528E0|nr:glutaredoxin family protein [Nocardia niwae]